MDIDLSQWWYDVSTSLISVTNESSLLQQMCCFGKRLGFEHAAVGAKGMSVPTHDAAWIISNYPTPWLEQYERADYISIDPTVRIGTRSRTAVIWSNVLFSKTPNLWTEAQDFGLRAGLSQSSWGRGNLFTLLSLARDRDPVTAVEANHLQPYILILSECVTSKLQHLIDLEYSKIYKERLSPREIEVLKWSALGKTAFELSVLLGVASATVQFHLQNAKRKLGVTTKIQATDYAKRLGLID